MAEEAPKKKEKVDWNYWDEVDEQRKHVIIFGRDVSEIPCFRNSFLYGIGSGVGLGLASFMFTSRPAKSTHIGFSTFFVTTLSYWIYCRYNYSVTKFQYSQLKSAMRDRAIYEGTAIEEEVNKASLKDA